MIVRLALRSIMPVKGIPPSKVIVVATNSLLLIFISDHKDGNLN